MKFRILEVNISEKYKYEIFYFNEMHDNRGPRWEKVVWDEKSICRFQDNNYTATIDEAKYQAALFKEKFEKEHGKLVEEFDL